MMIESTKFYILISVWMTLTFILGHNCVRKKIGVHFLASLSIDLNESQSVATICWFVEAYAIGRGRGGGGTSNTQGRELC